jgi:hypothetical protein
MDSSAREGSRDGRVMIARNAFFISSFNVVVTSQFIYDRPNMTSPRHLAGDAQKRAIIWFAQIFLEEDRPESRGLRVDY